MSARLFSSKSISISGKEIRSGFKNLSNNNPCFNGSNSVIPRAKAITDPPADPRPGPTLILFSLA